MEKTNAFFDQCILKLYPHLPKGPFESTTSLGSDYTVYTDRTKTRLVYHALKHLDGNLGAVIDRHIQHKGLWWVRKRMDTRASEEFSFVNLPSSRFGHVTNVL